MSGAVQGILERRDPGRVVYAPNYWQWYAHHRHHGTLPPELADTRTQLEVIRHLGLDVFSRNLYCDQRRGWFGGLLNPVWSAPVTAAEHEEQDGRDLVLEQHWQTPAGPLHERRRYVWEESTLVQEEFPITDYEEQAEALEAWLEHRTFRFDRDRWERETGRLDDGDVLCAGEVFSPLKLLHLLMGPEQTTFLLTDLPERAEAWMNTHHRRQIDGLRTMLESGVRAVMAMDNLDTMFHPPHYVERWSAPFYEEAAALCHRYDATFWIHACGSQRANLELIASLGVDGLEGVAFPPLGDVTLPEAFEMTGDRFLITGGISAIEFESLQTREAVFEYVKQLFRSLTPYRHRFMFSASCNTPINARWEQIVWFRDAWREYA
ncbi:uroporphyrinogen decarboxylase family protein [Kiritimatiella glycovorans]|uniref:Uroporphyrinogen decarboxylase (URO-D) domain-containing protein n=1 Tax=Kiritimatiella glycovorans TaxID=1307763 RepID=A0A0G3EK36_9BACT|nr:uroporphyrinogen decarboxylase family protein [Kiritimatiella glycovorans]AKJ65160.1 hypothetical protein L21SP4_01925 [Kiritimatiella glycovorans]